MLDEQLNSSSSSADSHDLAKRAISKRSSDVLWYVGFRDKSADMT